MFAIGVLITAQLLDFAQAVRPIQVIIAARDDVGQAYPDFRAQFAGQLLDAANDDALPQRSVACRIKFDFAWFARIASGVPSHRLQADIARFIQMVGGTPALLLLDDRLPFVSVDFAAGIG